LGISEGGFSRHALLIIIFVIIYLAILSIFLITYVLTKPLGAVPAASVSFVFSFAALTVGARVFWRFVKKLSSVEKERKSLEAAPERRSLQR